MQITLNKIANYLIVMLPIFLITGPFLSDLSVVLIDLIFIYFVTAQELDDDITLEKKPLVILPAKNHYHKDVADKIVASYRGNQRHA